MRYIINADDYGLHESCSKAIAEAFSTYLITDTTACANGDYYDDAIELAKINGFADRIGIHFNITTGIPLTDKIRKVRLFCDSEGMFFRDQNRYAHLNRDEKDALYSELMAQYSRLVESGIHVTHADSHHHIHTAPAYLSIFFQVFRECKINKVRILRNIGNANPLKRCAVNLINGVCLKKEFITTDFFAEAGAYFNSPLTDKVGVAELMVHPDFDRDKGTLIDRSKYNEGKPIGKSFDSLRLFLQDKQNDLLSYCKL